MASAYGGPLHDGDRAPRAPDFMARYVVGLRAIHKEPALPMVKWHPASRGCVKAHAVVAVMMGLR